MNIDWSCTDDHSLRVADTIKIEQIRKDVEQIEDRLDKIETNGTKIAVEDRKELTKSIENEKKALADAMDKRMLLVEGKHSGELAVKDWRSSNSTWVLLVVSSMCGVIALVATIWSMI
jgi:hypothetical protein